AARDLALAGQGQAVLVVQRRVADVDGDIAVRQVLVGQLPEHGRALLLKHVRVERLAHLVPLVFRGACCAAAVIGGGPPQGLASGRLGSSILPARGPALLAASARQVAAWARMAVMSARAVAVICRCRG